MTRAAKIFIKAYLGILSPKFLSTSALRRRFGRFLGNAMIAMSVLTSPMIGMGVLGRAILKSFENNVGKGEIARNEQFLLFPKCFLSFWRTFRHLYQT